VSATISETIGDLTDPHGLSSGDFNMDGEVDLFVPDRHPYTTNQYQRRSNIAVFAGQGNGQFTRLQQEHIRGGRTDQPRTAVTGDFDADGFEDIVTIDERYSRFFIHIGNGSGGFTTLNTAGQSISGPQAIAVGQYDTDGRPDIAIARSGEVEIYTGSSSGNFFGPLDIAFTGMSPNYVLFKDINGDTKDDLVVVGSTMVAVALRDNLPGTFQTPIVQTIPSVTNIAAVAAEDVDGDTKVDLVIAATDGSNPSVRWLKGDGIGNFAHSLQRSWWIPQNVVDMALVDLDGDTKFDVVTSHDDTSNDLYVRMGNGTDASNMFGDPGINMGTSVDHANTTLSEARGLQVADFDGDMELDVAVANATGSTGSAYVYLFKGDGSGGFTSVTDDRWQVYSYLPYGLTEGDFDNDGSPDLVTVGGYTSTSTEPNYRYSYTTTLINDGAGDLLPGISPTYGVGSAGSTSYYPWDVVVTDFDLDGDDDFAFTMDAYDRVGVVRGNGAGGFAPLEYYSVGNQPRRILAGDVSGNTAPDLVVANTLTGSCTVGTCMSVVPNLGATFSTTDAEFAVASPLVDIVLDDFDGNTEVDVVGLGDLGSAVDDEFISVFLSDGSTSFMPESVQTLNDTGTSLQPTAIARGDLNNDGKLDVVVALAGGDQIEIWLGNGNGTYITGVPYSVGNSPTAVWVGDVNNDGDDDVVVGLSGTADNIKVFFGNGNGTIDDSVSNVEVRSIPSYPQRFLFEDFNGDCLPDLAVVGDYTSNDGLFLFLTAP